VATADRNDPAPATSSGPSYPLIELERDFPDDGACLEWLWRERFAPDGHHAYCPQCDDIRRFHRARERPAWDCDSCGHHLHPLVGTIFQRSSTPLRRWFQAIHLMTSTGGRLSAKQLQRELGVTYKTAWRMSTLIRDGLGRQTRSD
jgi:transposase